MGNTTLDRWVSSTATCLGPLRAVVGDFTTRTGVTVDLSTALFLRARLAGLPLPGRTSAGGSCRLLATADGWAAVNLARAADHASLPALLALLAADDTELTGAACRTTASRLADAAQTVGIPAAVLGGARPLRRPVLARTYGGRRTRPLAGLRVLDLSALWAGPLCARLLHLAGAHVTKVESTTRPDGARWGNPEFYRWLHDGHDSLVLDFASGALSDAVEGADIVIEASRPRALRRLGVYAEEFLAARPGRAWVSITGYGRDDDRIAFGDDAAVAGGLVGRDAHGDPVFLGDALADPVTGLYAAHALVRSLASGGGELLCVSMAACAAALAASRTAVPC
jgi:hypothetical protein